MKWTFMTVAASALLTASIAPAAAESMPFPASDYMTRGKMAGGAAVTWRHSKGRVRMEMKAPGMPQPMTGYFDAKTGKGVMVMSLPGMPPMAIEGGPEQTNSGVVAGSGTRIGSDRVAGEDCDEWRVDPKTPEDKAMDAVACITRDGIMLRMVGNMEGKRQTIIEITEVSRAPQDPKLLTPPANLKRMQLPGGMMPPGR